MFTAKKVGDLPSFGTKLKKAREESGLSVLKAAQLLNVRAAYLERLESGEIDKLPAEVYAKALLKKYARIIRADADELIAEYEKEIRILRHLNKQEEHQSLPVLRFSRFALTPKVFNLSLGALILLGILGYLGWQTHFLLSPPSLSVSEPLTDVIIHQEDIKVVGKTEPGIKLLINGEQVLADSSGIFFQDVGLNQGLNMIKIEAINRFGKSNSIIRQIMVKPAETVQPSAIPLTSSKPELSPVSSPETIN